MKVKTAVVNPVLPTTDLKDTSLKADLIIAWLYARGMARTLEGLLDLLVSHGGKFEGIEDPDLHTKPVKEADGNRLEALILADAEIRAYFATKLDFSKPKEWGVRAKTWWDKK